MLTFQWKNKTLKQIEGSWNAWDIFTGLSQANGVHAKETKADLAEHAFFKGQRELKTLNVFF